MPIYHDIHIHRFLSGTRIQGDFATYIQKSLDIVWDGTPTAKLHILADPTHTDSKENTHIDIQKDPIYLLEAALIPILADMETTGVCIDRAKLQDIGMRIDAEKSLREAEIYDAAGERFNINSPKQLQEIFVKMNIPMTKKNKTGYSLDNDVLEEIAHTYPIARTVIAYRTLAKLKSTYTDGLLRAIDTKTSKIHTHYNQLGAATGRMSSEDPNLQNIPTGVGYPSEIKSCFGPSIGNTLLVADYSQIELRVLAYLSQDTALLDAFAKNEDIHTRTARYMYGDVDISADMRRVAKSVNFGVVYGITGYGLARVLDMSVADCTRYIDAFYAMYPGVRTYYDDILERGRTNGYVETLYGRRRYIPGMTDANKMIRTAADREAINMPVQGTAADILKYAMVDIYQQIQEKGLKGKMILQVHDELVLDVPTAEEHILTDIVRTCMESALQVHIPVCIPENWRNVPLRVDIHSGRDWVAAKG